MKSMNEKVIQANIDVHTRLAADYNKSEPHFREENIAKITERFARIAVETKANRQLDLGCGTGFMINIGKQFVKEIVGVDVTQAMLDQIDHSGGVKIKLVLGDTGSYVDEAGCFDIVTAYSFLHHLFDIKPTLKTAYDSLREGGVFYGDLEPNAAYWEAIGTIGRSEMNDSIIAREIEQVTYKDEDIEKQFGVDTETFNYAEYNKNIAGGFHETQLRDDLFATGFSRIEIFHQWFLGEGFLINDESMMKEERFRSAAVMSRILQRVMPLSRHLFKYIGFYATK
jgi:ubiquinone/menaquinone biosynthesis C-methylase UbiE